MPIELKPCPFCNQPPRMLKYFGKDGLPTGGVCIECWNLDCEIKVEISDGEQTAINKWNTRADASARKDEGVNINTTPTSAPKFSTDNVFRTVEQMDENWESVTPDEKLKYYNIMIQRPLGLDRRDIKDILALANYYQGLYNHEKEMYIDVTGPTERAAS